MPYLQHICSTMGQVAGIRLNMNGLSIVALLVLVHCSRLASAQVGQCDSNFVRSYDSLITARLFVTQKYLWQNLLPGTGTEALHYRGNSTLNPGVGFNYGLLSVNLAFGFKFLNRDDEKGKTRFLDLQTHTNTRKFAVDLYAQYYEGMFLNKNLTPNLPTASYYIRPDMRYFALGMSAYHILNWKRFSLRASYQQMDWQTKSAGSLLLGGEFYLGYTKADSAFVPAKYGQNFSNADVNRLRYTIFGPGIGYAYTLVVKKHWFATIAATATLPLVWVRETSDGYQQNTASIAPNYLLKGTVGYNSRRFTTSLIWTHNTMNQNGTEGDYRFFTGQGRFVVAYRFNASEKFKKKFWFLDGQKLMAHFRQKKAPIQTPP